MKEISTTIGRFTYCYIDTPTDRWLWSIVTDWKGPQEYGEMICAFDDDEKPNSKFIELILTSLNDKVESGELVIEEIQNDYDVIPRDRFDNEIQAGDRLDVQNAGIHEVYEKNGELYFKPYGNAERPFDYFKNDIVRVDEKGRWMTK